MKWLLAAWFVLGPAYWAVTDQFTVPWAVGWGVVVVVLGAAGAAWSPTRAWMQALAAGLGGAVGAVASLVTTQWLGLCVSLLQLAVAFSVISWCRRLGVRSPV